MLSLLFYLLTGLILIAVIYLFYYQRQKKRKSNIKKRPTLVNFNPPRVGQVDKVEEQPLFKKQPQFLATEDVAKLSPYDNNLIVLLVGAFPGKAYMGYELHQALLAAGLRFGEKNIFHRYKDDENSRVLFSLAAATADGAFNIEDMGSFKCNGLLLFMYLDAKQKLMTSFDLMLDTARQLVEGLGGEIYDELRQVINAEAIKSLRERICAVETSNLYVSDLLDNLD